MRARPWLGIAMFALLGCTATPLRQPETCFAGEAASLPKYDRETMTGLEVLRREEPTGPPDLLRRRPLAAEVEAIIGADGVVQDVCRIGGDPQWAHALMESVRKWQFKPAMRDGQPIAVRFRVTLTIR